MSSTHRQTTSARTVTTSSVVGPGRPDHERVPPGPTGYGPSVTRSLGQLSRPTAPHLLWGAVGSGEHPPEGYLVLPGLVEPHAHLDKALTADQVPNPSGSLQGAIEAWLGWRTTADRDHIRQRVRRAVLRYLANGTTVIRTHVDTGPDIGLRAIEAVLDVRAELGHLLDIQVVAAASLPLAGGPGTAGRSLVRDALAAGADLIGGAPWLDEHPADAVDVLLDIAADTGRGLDLHLDETLDPRARTLSILAARVLAGFPQPVTASHVVSLGQLPKAERRLVAEQVAAAGIGVVANPISNLFLQGRGSDIAPRGLTAIRELLDAGVAVAAGGDNLQDPFQPVGRADPLEAASLLVTAGHLTLQEAITAVTSGARRVLGLPVETVADARELVAIRASSVYEAVGLASSDRIVVHEGRVVARTTVGLQIDGSAVTW